jgi:hypothetical protein
MFYVSFGFECLYTIFNAYSGILYLSVYNGSPGVYSPRPGKFLEYKKFLHSAISGRMFNFQGEYLYLCFTSDLQLGPRGLSKVRTFYDWIFWLRILLDFLGLFVVNKAALSYSVFSMAEAMQ